MNQVTPNKAKSTPITETSRKVCLISLGCARNRVDSEVMLGDLFGKGYIYTPEQADADVIIVNTCGFIEAAKEESIETILEAASYKQKNKDLKLIVAGCLSQRYKTQLAKGLPEVDFFIGTSEFKRIPELLDAPPVQGAVFAKQSNFIYEGGRVNTLTPGSAYVKIAEGCQHNCAFCIIPAIRGRLRSRPIPNVVQEVEHLVGDGVVEINLVAQDLAAYGRDQGQDMLLPLLKELAKIEGLRWIRLLYLYPENISDELLDFIAETPQILKYMDIPTQHASDRVLAAMNRGIQRAELEAIFKKIRQRIPQVSLRTSVMAGFPSETVEDFEQLMDFVEKMKFDHLGCFAYSQEEGTVAGRMKEQIDEELRAERAAEVMSVQAEIAEQGLKEKVGRSCEVILERQVEPGLYEARASFQAPEVDGKTYLKGVHLKVGQIYPVVIREVSGFDLVAEVATPES